VTLARLESSGLAALWPDHNLRAGDSALVKRTDGFGPTRQAALAGDR
jgi:hypothetical protein